MRLIPKILFLCLAVISSPAFADCISPAGVEGEIVYNQTHKVAQFCDGTDWNSMKAANAGLRDDCTNAEVLKWDGSGWNCAADNAGSGGDGDTLAGLSCSNDQIAKWNGTTWACAADAGITAETDPQVGTLTNDKWCTTDGSAVNCTSDTPGGAPSCTIRSNSTSVSADEQKSVSVSCTGAEIVVGGGCRSTGGYYYISRVFNSYPSSTTTWNCHTYNSTTAGGFTFYAYAICCAF